MLDLNEIYLFVEVVRGGSFAEAARRLNMPANTVGRRIQQLENALKNRLFLRTTRKLTLTAIGQAFYQQCAHSIEQLVQASEEAAESRTEPAGPLRVAVSNEFVELFSISGITAFLKEYPKVKLELFIDNAFVDLISIGVDVAFRSELMLDGNSIRRVLGTSRERLVAAPQYVALHGAPKSIDELGQHCCLIHSRASGPITWHLDGPNGNNQVEVRGCFLASNPNPIRSAAIEGLGIALLPEVLVNSDIEDGRLVSVLDQYRSKESRFCAVFPSHRHIGRAASMFVEYVQSMFVSKQRGQLGLQAATVTPLSRAESPRQDHNALTQ